jgi:hypothetical protein
MKNYPMGSISSGTMQEKDLIPAFLDELEYHVRQGKKRGYLKEINRIRRAVDKDIDDSYFHSEDASFDLEYLFNSLNDFAAPYFYFGAHPGDGADFGFWLSEDMEYDFDGLKVEDLSEVPKEYRGEVLHINDHGNISLYIKNSRGFKEIWGIV